MSKIVFEQPILTQPIKVPSFCAAISVSITSFSVGNILAWTSPAGPQLKNVLDDEYKFLVDDHNMSWIASAMTLGATISCIPVGLLMNKFGRKTILLSTIIFALIGWGLILGATDILMMVCGRMFLGVTVAISQVACAVYIGEISTKENRGILGSFLHLLLSLGIVFVYATGTQIRIFLLTLICAIVPLIFGALFVFMPETPMFLIHVNKKEKAAKSLTWLRGKNYDVKYELEILEAEDHLRKLQIENLTIKEKLRQPGTMKSLLIAIGLGIMQQSCGINVITFYAMTIFVEAKTDLSPGVQSIILSLMQVVTNIIVSFIVERLGRRALILVTGCIMGLSAFTLGSYFFVKDNFPEYAEFLRWLPLLSMIVFVCAYGLGVGPIPYILHGELYCPNIKGLAVGLAMTFSWFTAFLVTKFFAELVSILGTGPTFWIFSILNFIGIGFIYYMIPETKGKTFAEIQDIMKSR